MPERPVCPQKTIPEPTPHRNRRISQPKGNHLAIRRNSQSASPEKEETPAERTDREPPNEKEKHAQHLIRVGVAEEHADTREQHEERAKRRKE